jgi:hypothetical protein
MPFFTQLVWYNSYLTMVHEDDSQFFKVAQLLVTEMKRLTKKLTAQLLALMYNISVELVTPLFSAYLDIIQDL